VKAAQEVQERSSYGTVKSSFSSVFIVSSLVNPMFNLWGYLIV
jgi:hypothetical protein